MQLSESRYWNFICTLGLWIFWGSLIGTIIGSTTAFLINTNDLIGEFREKNSWLIYFLPVGGLVLGYLYQKYGKDSAKGNNLIIDDIHNQGTMLMRTGPIVYIGTFITVLFGGSTGREGAAIQMGGSVAQAINRLFKVSLLDTKILLMSGISAGFGAAFGTPLTGAIFGMEMSSVGKFKYEALVHCTVASFLGHRVATAWGIKHEHFIIKKVPELSFLSVSKVIVVAIVFGLISLLYCQLRHQVQKTSEAVLKTHMKRAFVGGLIIIALTLFVGTTDYNGRSLEVLENSFTEAVPPYAFIAKLLFTAFTMGMGFVGGEAIPLFFIGATLGNTLSSIIDLPSSFLAAIGLIAVFCGGANTPIASLILAVEMFEGKGLEYFLLACIVSFIVSGHHGLWPAQKLYEPKSRLWNLQRGKTIKSIEEKNTET